MAPTRKDYASSERSSQQPAQKSKFLSRVRDGRIGQVRPKNGEGGRAGKNAGKELFTDKLPGSIAVFPKKRGGSSQRRALTSQAGTRSLARQRKTVEELDAEMDAYWSEHNNDIINNAQPGVQDTSVTHFEPFSRHLLGKTSDFNITTDIRNKKESTNPGKNLPRSFLPKLRPSKAAKYKTQLRTFNTTALKINQTNNQITKRLALLSASPAPYSHPIIDTRDAQTITTDTITSIPSNTTTRKLNIWFALTFHTAITVPTAPFTPLRIFNLSTTKFSDPNYLARRILHDPAMIEAGKSVGINTQSSDVTIVGFELCFPKDVTIGVPRHENQQQHEGSAALSLNDGIGKEGEGAELVQVQIQAGRKSLVNTPCVLNCWFEQVHALVADVHGDVAGLVVIGHVGRVETDTNTDTESEELTATPGSRRILPFDKEWRSQEERYWLGRERVFGLQGQVYRDADEEERMKVKMREIELGAERAVFGADDDDDSEQWPKEEGLPFGHPELLDDEYLMNQNQGGAGYDDEYPTAKSEYIDSYEEYLSRMRY